MSTTKPDLDLEGLATTWAVDAHVRLTPAQFDMLETLLRTVAEQAREQGGRDWQEKAAGDGRYLPHHSVGWLVVNGEVCRKRHTDFINDPCVFEDLAATGFEAGIEAAADAVDECESPARYEDLVGLAHDIRALKPPTKEGA